VVRVELVRGCAVRHDRGQQPWPIAAQFLQKNVLPLLGVSGRWFTPRCVIRINASAVENFLPAFWGDVADDLIVLFRWDVLNVFVGEAASVESLSLRWRDFRERGAGHGAQIRLPIMGRVR